MNLEKFLKLNIGETVGYLESDLSDSDPIVTITETIRPRLIGVVNEENGRNHMVTLSYDTEKKAHRLQYRLREPDGAKRVPPYVHRHG